MGKQQKAFKPGDYVFAKVKGYPAWPAKIVSLNGKKYNIYFYGTGESGNLPANDIFDYFAHKTQFLAKVLKRRDYNEGLAQIESETTEAGLTSNGDKMNITTDSTTDLDETVNKTNVTVDDADQTINTTVSEVDTTIPEPVKIPKKRAAEANTSITQPPAKSRKIEEPAPVESEPEPEVPVVEKDETPPPEPENIPVENEPEDIPMQEDGPEETSPAAEPVADSAPVVVSRGRKPSIKTPLVTPQKSPRRSVKQEVMSPVYEPHVPAPESVSRSGRKIKPKRYLDEEAIDPSIPQTPGKKIKIQPTTPNASAEAEDEEQELTPPMEVVDNPPVETPIVVPAAVPNDTIPRKGRKKIIKNSKQLNFISRKELENTEGPNFENRALSNKDDVLAAVLPSGKIVGIKLYKDFPESFGSQSAQEQWVSTMIKNAIQLKSDLENGQINPATITNQLEMEPTLSANEMAAFKKERDTEIRQRKLRLLKLECKLVGLEKDIKIALNLTNADIDKCIILLDELSELEINRTMILKQSGMISLIKNICHYIGNSSSWKLSEEDMAKFADKADIIRKKAHECLAKIMDLFGMKNEKTFYYTFSELLLIFKMHTDNLSPQEYLELVDEPSEMISAYKTVTVSEDGDKKNIDQLSNNKHESKADIKTIPKKAESSRQAVQAN